MSTYMGLYFTHFGFVLRSYIHVRSFTLYFKYIPIQKSEVSPEKQIFSDPKAYLIFVP